MYVSTVTVTAGTWREQLGDTYGRIYTNDAKTPAVQPDEGLNDSDKTLTVPPSTEWEIESIWVELTSTAVPGNRQVTVEIQDAAADVIGVVKAGIVQAASLTRNYLFAPYVADLAAFRDTAYLTNPIPKWTLPASYAIRVYDSAAIDAAADDLVLQVHVRARST